MKKDESGIVVTGAGGLQQIANSLKITDKLLSERKIESVIIGEQEWMTRNLNVSRFKNGDTIPEITDPEEWATAGREGKPAWCYYDNDPENGKVYGKLYNWYAVNDDRGLAPDGWRIPKHEDWKTLLQQLMNMESTVVEQEIPQGVDWRATDWGAVSNPETLNDFGFSYMLGGSINYEGEFHGFKESEFWWTATDFDSNDARIWLLDIDLVPDLAWFPCSKRNGSSIRCVKESTN